MSRSMVSKILILLLPVFLFTTPISVFGQDHDDSEQTGNEKEHHCSTVSIVNNGYSILATNNDSECYTGLVFINKRGISKSTRMQIFDPHWDDRDFRWTAQYASITFNHTLYTFPWCGMNEKGLAFSTMALSEHVPSVDNRTYMTSALWWQYVLDTCETIDDIRATDAQFRIWTVDHFLVTDRFGNSAVIEFENGHMVIYTGDNLPIASLTNLPYEACSSYWEGVKHTSSDYNHLDDSNQRFCIASDRVDNYSSRSDQEAVNYAFDIIGAVGQRLGPKAQWGIVFDTKNLRTYWHTENNRDIRYVDLYNFDLSCGTEVMILDVKDDLLGDAAGEFFDYDWDTGLEYLRMKLACIGENFPDSVINAVLNAFGGFSCSDDGSKEGIPVAAGSEIRFEDAHAVVNPNSGNVLVIWAEANAAKPSESVIRSAMLMRSLSGIYSAAEFRTLSNTSGYNGHSCPLYVSSTDKFLVVWDQADPEKPASKSAILGHVLSANGLPEGNVTTVVPGNKRSESPQVFERSGSSGIGASESAIVDLVYFSSKVKKKGTTQPALNITRLGADYKSGKAAVLLKGKTKKVGKVKVSERIIPAGGGIVAGSNLLLAVDFAAIQEDGSLLNQPKIICIDVSNLVVEVDDLGEAGAAQPRLCAFENNKGDSFVFASTLLKGEVTNHAFSAEGMNQVPSLTHLKSKAEKQKAAYSFFIPLAPLSTADLAVEPSGKHAAGYQFFAATNGSIYRRKIADTAKTVGSYVTVIKDAKGVGFITGTEILISGQTAAKKAELLIIWNSKTSDGYELRAKAFSVSK